MASGVGSLNNDEIGFGEVDGFSEPRSAQNTLTAQASTSLPSSCTVLTCTDPIHPFGGEQSFYIVGTAHVSMESCEDVRKVIQEVKPEVGSLTLIDKKLLPAVIGLHLLNAPSIPGADKTGFTC